MLSVGPAPESLLHLFQEREVARKLAEGLVVRSKTFDIAIQLVILSVVVSLLITAILWIRSRRVSQQQKFFRKWRNMSIIGIIVFIVLYISYIYFSTEELIPYIDDFGFGEPTITPTGVILDQVYRNKAYGIELRYPLTWSLKDNTSEFHPIDIELSSPDYKEKPLYGEAMGGRMVTSGGIIVLSDYGVPNVDYQGIRSFDGLKSKRAEETKWRGLDITETTVDGHNALYEFTQDQDARILQEAFIFGMPDLPIDLPVLRFRLETSKEADEAKFSDIFLQILGTLRFSGSNARVTPEKAAQLVQNLPEAQAFLRRVDPSGKVDFEGDVEGKNAYLIHVYELLSDHTATFNWYEVDKVTGEVRAQF